MKYSVILLSCMAALASAKFQNGAYLLPGKCHSDDECGRRCSDVNEYKNGVVPKDQLSKIDKFATYLKGSCGWDNTEQCGCYASDDSTCANIYTCAPDYKKCVPKAKQSTDPKNFLCDCPLVCNEADGHKDWPH